MLELVVPGILAGVACYGMAKGVDVYDALLVGAGKGLEILLKILPALVTLLTVVAMLRASGGLEVLADVLAPVLGWLGIPPETVGLMLVRPISGSAALGVGSELISTYGPDSTIGRTAAVMLGSTETTFYTIAVYFVQDTTWRSTVRIELGAILFCSNCKTYGVLCHRDRGVSNQSVKSKAWNMENIGRLEPYRSTLSGPCFIGRGLVLVVELSLLIAVNHHAVWHERIQRHHFTLSVSNNLCVSVAPEKQMRHERFSERKRSHLRIWLIVQNEIQRLVNGLLLTSFVRVSI